MRGQSTLVINCSYTQSNLHIYSKYGDCLNVDRSKVETISIAKDNKDNKREACVHES
jgi:hypothetical protein